MLNAESLSTNKKSCAPIAMVTVNTPPPPTGCGREYNVNPFATCHRNLTFIGNISINSLQDNCGCVMFHRWVCLGCVQVPVKEVKGALEALTVLVKG